VPLKNLLKTNPNPCSTTMTNHHQHHNARVYLAASAAVQLQKEAQGFPIEFAVQTRSQDFVCWLDSQFHEGQPLWQVVSKLARPGKKLSSTYERGSGGGPGRWVLKEKP